MFPVCWFCCCDQSDDCYVLFIWNFCAPFAGRPFDWEIENKKSTSFYPRSPPHQAQPHPLPHFAYPLEYFEYLEYPTQCMNVCMNLHECYFPSPAPAWHATHNWCTIASCTLTHLCIGMTSDNMKSIQPFRFQGNAHTPCVAYTIILIHTASRHRNAHT